MTTNEKFLDDLTNDFEDAQELYECVSQNVKGTSTQFEALFAQILADVRLSRVIAEEEQERRTVTVGTN